MHSVLQRAVTFVRHLWQTEPARVIAIITAAVVFVGLKAGIVLDEHTVAQALAYVLPILLGGEAIRSQVTPAARRGPDLDELGDDDLLPHVPVTALGHLPPDLGEQPPAFATPRTAVTDGVSVSRLTATQRARVRQLVGQALSLSARRAGDIDYTQGPERWAWKRHGWFASKGAVPRNTDCSGWATWVLYQGLRGFRVGDVVNGQRWTGGYTGTMLDHGKVVHRPANIQVGDLAIYGQPGTAGAHVAVCIGGGYVLSHGSPGIHKLPLDYRGDLLCVRRYI